MCGIAGIVGPHACSRLLDQMLTVQMHRGPDGEGRHVSSHLAMGMRRLSIIDPSGGWQPLKSRDGRVLAFQNGEIYNYRELRLILEAMNYRFVSNSDTEVLAHGYDAWGMDGLLSRVDGMYAIAILDLDARCVHLARDRFGEKPLFYMMAGGHFAWASSLKSLAVLPWFHREIDTFALDRYLALHYVSGSRTIFRQIRRLLPGFRMTVSLDDLTTRIERYYAPSASAPMRVSHQVVEAEVEAAIRSRLVADVPVGVFLSGGIDSSIVAVVASRYNPGIKTFSIGFPGLPGDESPYAEMVAQHLGTRHKTLHFDSHKFHELLPQVAGVLDEPLGDQAMLPLFWLCREAVQEVKVVLSGEGGDELFAGYDYYKRFSAPPWPQSFGYLQKNPNRVAPVLMGPTETASGFPILSGQDERRSLFHAPPPMEADDWEKDTEVWLASARDPVQRASLADIAGWLPDDLLVKLDRVAMGHSLEGRAPFLTPRLAECALNLAPEQRMQGDQTKVALRHVARHWLPREILERPKQGFNLPMRKWLTEWFERAGGPYAYFKSGPLLSELDVDAVAGIVQRDIQNGLQRERLLFSLIMLVEWYRAFQRVPRSAF